MSKEIRVLQLTDKDDIYQFEQKLIRCRVEDEIEREFAAWHAAWRAESLEHYLPLGWSFGIFDDDLKGYFLGQPQLFTQGMTQTLWLEHIGYADESLKDELIDIARRICREKHFQMLHVNISDSETIKIKTAKF